MVQPLREPAATTLLGAAVKEDTTSDAPIEQRADTRRGAEAVRGGQLPTGVELPPTTSATPAALPCVESADAANSSA